jgi:hypothetical protein
MKTFRKQPGDHLDYDIDMSDWLNDDDTVNDVEVEAPDGIELTGTDIEDNAVKLWIKGGEDGNNYQFSPLIHTTQARTKEVDFLVVVTEQ